MNNFFIAYHTDIGIKKQTNQDSLLLNGLVAPTGEEILLALLCDGMGGTARGELASATVIRAFARWFREDFIHWADKWTMADIKEAWDRLFRVCNDELINYGEGRKIQLGTTATALMISSAGKYAIGHIGDTRAYCISQSLQQLTEDHTFVAREIRRGTMTREQAAIDNRRNVLLQCVGINQYFEPQYLEGNLEKGEAFLICSDGFRHELTESEMKGKLSPTRVQNEEQIKQWLIELVELNKQRGEADNISAIYIQRK